MYVLGDKMGQRVMSQQRQPMPSTGGVPGMAAMGGGMQHQAAMLAQQNREMEQLERRQARERAAGMGAHAVCSFRCCKLYAFLRQGLFSNNRLLKMIRAVSGTLVVWNF